MKSLMVYLYKEKTPQAMLGYEVLRSKLVDFDLIANTKYLGLGLSKDISSTLSAGVYVADTYSTMFKGKFKPKFGVGFGITF